MKGWLPGLALALLVGLAAGALAQEHHWSDGDVQIVPVHPDLGFEDDGAVHSSGDFLAQIVLRGEDADAVEEVAFSFGAGPPSPAYHPGYVGLWDYRVDADGEDGWFIPITTSDTPAGDYKFAAHAYASAGDPSSEIARHWGAAAVEDGDQVGPWPAILPGETERTTNPHGVSGVTIEFAENASAQLFVDGEPVELSSWTPPARDDDDIPRHTEEARVLGDGYRWQGEVTEGTVLRVEAVDEAGNAVTKGALVGHGIDNPVLEVRLEAPPTVPEPGEDLTVPFEVANVGLAAADPELSALAPAEWNATASRRAGPIDPGGTTQGTLSLSVPDDATPQGTAIGVEVTYSLGGQNVTSVFDHRLGAPADAGAGEGSEIPSGETGGEELEAQADPGEGDGIPFGTGASLVGVLLAALAAARAR